MKNKFKIPVEYLYMGAIEVEAETLEEAIRLVNENSDDYPLPDESDYVDGSFRVSGDTFEQQLELAKIYLELEEI